MCGIGGILGDRAGLDGSALLRALRHRGPDHQGEVALSPEAWLCAARLAISDPSPAGNQPMSDGELTIVHNGEVYNAPALRRELEGRGHRFRSRCDTEVILVGYREWGEAVTERIDGMWAFAVWDAGKRTLLLARDPIGVKPLWLARRGATLTFASEVRALLAAGAVAPSLDSAAVASFLATGSVAEPRALVAGVEALPPGHRALFAGGHETRTRFWSLPHAELAPPADEAARAVRKLLAESLDGCLEADVPVALLLSGGIDSAALALVAGRGRNLRTFHVKVGQGAARRAAELAGSLGFHHEEVTLDGAQVRNDLPGFLRAQDQPSIDGANTYFIARAIHRAGLKAAVTGLGADEIFLGYPLHRSYVRARNAELRLDGLAAPLGRVTGAAAWLAARAPRGSWWVDKALGVAQAAILPDPGVAARATYAALRAIFPAAMVARLLDGAPSPLAHLRGEPPIGLSAAAEVSRLEVANYLVDTLLRDADVMSMAHGVELRVPMLDRRLVELVTQYAAPLKLRDGRQKPLLVDAVPELPPAFAGATKEGFELPFNEWLAGELRAPVEDALRGREDAERVGLRPRAVAAVWGRFLARRDRPSAFRAWALYSLFAWAREHAVSR